MKNSGKLVSFLVPIISILLAFVIGCIIMAVLGANPFVALESLWIGAFGSLRNVPVGCFLKEREGLEL